MRPQRERDEVLRLHRLGLNAPEIARRTGIPSATVREWINPRYRPRLTAKPKTVDLVGLPKREYSYLLGFYLGDGTISRHDKGVYRLRIVTDSAYPDIVNERASPYAHPMSV